MSLFTGACYATPLLGGLCADSYSGAYATIIVFSVIYILGLSGIALSALLAYDVSALTTPASLLLVALGTGGIKPVVGPFGALQIGNDEAEVAGNEAGRAVARGRRGVRGLLRGRVLELPGARLHHGPAQRAALARPGVRCLQQRRVL